ncbi:MAG: M56 family metallopeptidase [Bacteroidales bacterium]|nr:M56 family metallopeptidase [Bacteroidales bacterium]
MSSLILSLLVPVVHVNYVVKENAKLKEAAFGIEKFRSAYEELIAMLDADFGAEPGSRYGGGIGSNENEGLGEVGRLPIDGRSSLKGRPGEMGDVNITRILFLIYIGGVLYFLVRFIYLIIRLFLMAKRNGVSKQDGFRIVEINEDISPFSFFRFLFINSSSFDEQELQNVLEHEKAHIMQKHSLDHLFAHGLAVFQWFNPFAWQMRTALKTTHEYIADRQVINKGFELFDYQSILLKQVIGYHSVELVNNFNLKPIKKRIIMMTKNKSGYGAKLKATLVIPIAIISFFLFADFTLKVQSPEIDALEHEEISKEDTKQLFGLWINKSEDENPAMLHIDNDFFSFLRGTVVEKSMWTISNNFISLRSNGAGAKGLEYRISGDELFIKWNDKDETKYSRCTENNTLDILKKKQDFQVELPSLTQYRIMENEELITRLAIEYTTSNSVKLKLDGSPISQKDLVKKIDSKISNINRLDRKEFSVLYYVDIKVPMGIVSEIRSSLINTTRRFADAGYPYGEQHQISPLLFDKVALPRIMPPPDAPYMEIDELKKMGLDVMVIDLAARNLNPRELEKKISGYIPDNKGKYLISLVYDKEIPYGQYIETVGMIFNIIYKFRNELSINKYGIGYAELGDALQRVVRKEYPVSMSEKMLD